MPGKLIIVCGLPGSGKTTHARSLEQKLGAIRLSPDEWMEALGINLWDEAARARIESLQWNLARQLLTLSQTVIIEWGTWAKQERDTLRLGARELGASAELHFLDAPVDVLFERIKTRALEDPPIGREDIVKWSELIERPTEAELALFDC